MALEIRPITPDRLDQYVKIPIAFEVRSVLSVEVVEHGLGGITFREEPVRSPYVKDYDASPDGSPLLWPSQWDVSNWGFFLAIDIDEGTDVGAMAIAHRTPGMHMLAGRGDVAVLWDIRVCPERRHTGVGSALFEHAAAWSRKHGCAELRIDTQDVNAPACRFYARSGCRLILIDREAYASCPPVARETKLVWALDLERV